MKTIEDPIVIEATYHTSIEKVWNAITDINQMRLWYFENIPEFKPEIGFKTQFNVKSGERNFLHKWKVIEVMPFKKITYNWNYENYEGDSNVTFELFKEENSVKLKLTDEVLADFDDNIPEFKRESGVAGWTYFIKERLKEFLSNNG